MSDLLQDVAPSLFDAPPPASDLHAKEFVRWCCSFGSGFRNSPDMTNLRYWASKHEMEILNYNDILNAARHLFLKRVERAVREAERTEKSS